MQQKVFRGGGPFVEPRSKQAKQGETLIVVVADIYPDRTDPVIHSLKTAQKFLHSQK
jgi:hypothetical protein